MNLTNFIKYIHSQIFYTRHSGRYWRPSPQAVLCTTCFTSNLSQLPQNANIFAMKRVTYKHMNIRTHTQILFKQMGDDESLETKDFGDPEESLLLQGLQKHNPTQIYGSHTQSKESVSDKKSRLLIGGACSVLVGCWSWVSGGGEIQLRFS